MRLILPLIIGVVLGLGGSVGAEFFWDPYGAALMERIEEARAAGPSEPDTLAAVLAQAPASRVPAAEPATGPVAADSVASPAETLAAAQDSSVVRADSTAAPVMQPERLAKVFATMQAREAARILEHMDDVEVQVILEKLGDRQAAAILANLSPQRAAVISRTVIRGERS